MTPPNRVLAVALVMAAGCVDAPPGTRSAAIVGGEVDLEHTAVVDVLLEGEQSCTGTLISPHVVLTAAHCVVEDVEDPTELAVFTGPDQSDLAGGELHELVAWPIQPTYGTDPKDEDIGDMAVLVLAEPSTIEPMQYNRQLLTEDMIGRPVTVVGYGDTTIQVPTRGGGTRRSVSVPLHDFNVNWVLAGGGGESQCYGDSGGPVLLELGGVERIIGLDSWAARNNCGGVEHNTRIDLLSPWIDEQVQEYDPGFGDDGGDGGPGDGDGSDGGETDDGGDASADGDSGGCQTGAAPHGPGALCSLLALALLVAGQKSRRKPVMRA